MKIITIEYTRFLNQYGFEAVRETKLNSKQKKTGYNKETKYKKLIQKNCNKEIETCLMWTVSMAVRRIIMFNVKQVIKQTRIVSLYSEAVT